VDLVASAPGEGTFTVTALRGAIADVPEDATAYAGRAATFDLSADIAWTDPDLDEAARAWARETMAAVEADATLGRYANGISAADPEMSRAIYGDAKLARLTRLKRAWDPHNVFRVNHNVAPVPEPR
jgi:FAD/FMN-containing dehydrogenase